MANQPDQFFIDSALRTIALESSAISALGGSLDASFATACHRILETAGRVVVTGMGKSGHIAGKIAATLASTGTPAFFVHPGEASHGDMGMITQSDCVIALSNSGGTFEILTLLPLIKRLNIPLISITGDGGSELARASDVHLLASIETEACPLNLAPTTSSLNTLVLGDALAVALMEKRGFEAADFAATHPGGALGRRLLTHVRDRMRVDNLPFVDADSSVQDALITMTEGRLGLTLVGTAEKPDGILTDGDLRRLLVSGVDLAATRVGDVASADPLTITPDTMMAEAEEKMLEARVQCLVVVDDQAAVVGILQIFE